MDQDMGPYGVVRTVAVEVVGEVQRVAQRLIVDRAPIRVPEIATFRNGQTLSFVLGPVSLSGEQLWRERHLVSPRRDRDISWTRPIGLKEAAGVPAGLHFESNDIDVRRGRYSWPVGLLGVVLQAA